MQLPNWAPRNIMTDVTQIVNAIEQQDGKAADQLLPLVYEELRRLAAQKMSQEPPRQTLQVTASVLRTRAAVQNGLSEKWSCFGSTRV
jgi:hypothetical protein